MMRDDRLDGRRWSAKWALLAAFVGIVCCNRENVTPQPEAAVSSVPAPITSASTSASAGSQPRRAPWRTSPNARFEELGKQCDDGAATGCEAALVLVLEAEHAYGAKPFAEPNVERIPTIAKRGCDLGNKLACAFIKRAEVDKLPVRHDKRWHEMVRALCDTGGDPLCFSYRNGAPIDRIKWTWKACEQGIGTECLALVTNARDYDLEADADQKRFAQKACDAYIQTCYDAIERLLPEHPERTAWPEVRAMHERSATEQSKRCAEGQPTCGFAAYAMLELGRDYAEIRRYAEAGLEDRDELAAYVVGRLAEEALGQPADLAMAAKFYEKCGWVVRDWEKVCHARLSELYEKGKGVPKDTNLAFKHALLGRSRIRVTPTTLRYIRLFREKSPPPSKEELMKAVKSDCNENADPRCPTLWKLVEEGKPIPEALPER
ncbi:hypothetical protein [Polyangium jinanense]|uniref:Beta-lactamase n=1 Tax=Polyangium jinanense TaxID=2829994 RepID=A0A9X4AZ42_9BACT|nr:hypothetical protein [Polyangium jinanense]MDC3961585.1 hypothetical protein [Polyangium jinanense]MDC3987950.1 hypothetical protein [Polyangium jinanense]